MDPRFQTSFIPKKPVLNSTGSASKTINLFSLIATLLFIATISLAVGVYFYNTFVIKQIVDSKKTLDLAKGAFEPDLINKIVNLNKKIDASRNLLTGHVSPSYFFDVVADFTLQSVRFKSFGFDYLTKDKITLTMQGHARSFEAVALQSDALNAEKTLKDPVISSFSLNADGTVSFDVTATILSSSILYQDILKAQSVGQKAPQSPGGAVVGTTTNSEIIDP